ncbi:MAG: PAS domain S-box protein [Desulfofustis sp.]|jgi:PAS domain S-box-containing protein|nr:PAS domain S-box protein [Desulfofustis sp.]
MVSEKKTTPDNPDPAGAAFASDTGIARADGFRVDGRGGGVWLDSLLRAIPAGVAVLDHGSILQVNGRMCEITGYDREQLIGSDAQRLFAARSKDLLDPHLRLAADGGSETETTLVCRDGTLRDVLLTSASIAADAAAGEVVLAVLDITERKRIERQLRQTSEELQNYFSQSLDLLCIADTDGRFVRLNPEWERVLGYPVQEMIGQHYLDFVHPDDVASTVAKVSQLYDGRQVHNFVNRYRTSDGEYRWIEWRSASSGETVYAAARDISERVASEAALRRSEQQFRAVFEQAGVGVVQADITSGAIIQANRRFCQVVGYLPEEIERLTIGELTHPDDLLRERAFIDRLITGAIGEFSHEKRYLHKDGQLVWVNVTVSPMWAADEPPRFCIGVVQDISARKKAEEALRQSEASYRTVLEHIQDVFYRSDAEGRLVMISPAGVRMLGYHSVEEMLGRPNAEFWKNPAQRAALLEKLRVDGHVHDYEVTLVRRDGTEVPVSTSSRFYYDDTGVALGIEGVFRDITERKRAETDTKRQKVLFESLFAGSPEAIAIVDRDDRVVDINASFTAVFGYQRSEALGRSINELVAVGEECADARQISSAVMEDGQIVQQESRRRRKDGSLVDVAVIGFPILIDGQLSGAFGIYHDISDRKQAERNLRESEARLKSLFETMPNGYYRSTPAGRFVDVNTAYVKMLGYENREELLAVDIAEALYVRPEERGKTLKNRHNREFMEASHSETYRLRTKDGRIIDIEDNARYIYDQSGSIIYHEGICRDVTDRRRAEDALRASEERFAKAFQANPGPMVISDIETGRFIDANESWLTMLGHSREETVGHTSWEIGLWNDPNHRYRAVAELKRHGSFHDVKTEFRTKTGEIRFVLWSAEIITLGGRQVMLSLLHDMTAQQRAEEERLRLEEHVRQAQKMEAIGTLAGGIAHDFNNLLTTIMGNVALIRHKHMLEPSVQERIRIIEEMVQRGADLTRQLLGFAKGGKYEVRPVDLNALLRESLDMFGRTHREISIATEFADGPLTVEIDRGQIHQVLLNIFINAAHAMPGGGRLEVHSETVTVDSGERFPGEVAPGKYGRITITDSGHGMDSETMQRVFDPFFTTKPVGKGTGLGLASAYGIVKNHGGAIQVVSRPGAGSSFIIFLPTCNPPVEPTESAASQVMVGESRQETILVVDDEEMILAVSRDLLTELGYRVLTAISGDQALQQFTAADSVVDLVILDMILPDMDGSAIFDRLRQHDPRIKVLLASGYSVDQRARAILERGCNGFIQKPYNMHTLAGKVREILDGQASAKSC